MCWVAIIPKKKAYETLDNQRLRWLDSLWIIDFQSGKVHTSKKDTLLEYKEYIEWTLESNDELCFMHNRKASIGIVNLDNSHPFTWKKFLLAQNWTSKEFMTTYWTTYWKDTDSETLLMYLEDHANNLEECIEVLDEIDDLVWIILIFFKWKTLIYADSTRWSHIEIEDFKKDKENPDKVTGSRLIQFTNLKDKTNSEYRNWFYMIIDSITWNIEKEWNYDKQYNDQLYSSIYTHGIKSVKKTQKTKKNNTGPTGYSNNQSALIVNPRGSKKNKERTQTWKKRSGGKSQISKKKMMTQLDIGTILTATSKYKLEELEVASDIEIVLSDYWVDKILNDISITMLAKSLAEFIWNEVRYNSVMNLIARKAFTLNWDHTKEIYLDKIFCVPLWLLIPIEAVDKEFIFLNHVRHIRFINTLSDVELWFYMRWLNYFWRRLKDLQYEEEYNKVRDNWCTIETYLWLEWKEEPSFNQVVPYMIESNEVSKWLIKAWYTLWLNADDLNVEKDVYNNITRKY